MSKSIVVDEKGTVYLEMEDTQKTARIALPIGHSIIGDDLMQRLKAQLNAVSDDQVLARLLLESAK